MIRNKNVKQTKIKASDHDIYGVTTIVSLLVPTVGIILGIVYLSKSTKIDRKLGEHLIAVGILSCIVAGIIWFGFFATHTITPLDTTTSSIQNTPIVESNPIIKPSEMAKVGEEIQLNNFKMRVNSVESKNTITSQGQIYSAAEGTKYLVINMTLTNTTKEPISLFGNFGKIILMDDNETTYKPTSEEVSFTPESIALLNLNPGVPDTGILTFRLPASVVSTNVGCLNLDGTKFIGTKISW